jgi:hypothetical protein
LFFLKDNIFVLWDETSGAGHSVAFETSLINTNGPEEDISELMRLLSSLPPSMLKLLVNCDVKIFDIGLEGGVSGEPLNMNLSAPIIAKISQLGFSVGIRVYPAADKEPDSN